MWVVRDFTLRLVDNLGNPITSKEYLERSLQPHNTNENDEKNKIRKHLTGYFKERDCTTLVRPIEKEKDLQNLDNLELECLRKEFTDQVYLLREKVLYKIKPKSLNGRELSGEMLSNLIISYVNSMNSGIVPNIESSWTLVCRLQNQKILDEAKQIYEKAFADNKKSAINEGNLKKMHSQAKISCFQYFNNYVVIEDPKMVEELSAFISQRYKQFKDENSLNSKKECINYLRNSYSQQIENKIKQGEITSLGEFEKSFNILEKEYNTTNTGPLKKECFLEFYKEKLARFSDLLLHSATNELAIHKDLTSEHLNRLEKELKIATDQLIQEKNSSQKAISLFQSEKSEFLAKEKNFKDQISALMMDREKLETSLRETSEALKQKNQLEIEKVTLKNSELNENIKELERELARKKSQIEEERALSSQKIKMLESSLEDIKNKEKISSEKLKDMKNDSASSSKTIQIKYEGLIAKLQEKLDSKGHDYKDLESEIENKEATIEELKQSLADIQISNATEKSENLSLIDVLQRKLKQKEDELLLKVNNIEQDNQNEILRLKYKLEDAERKLKHSEEEIRNGAENLNQEIAILSQKNEFLEQEVEEQRVKRQEEKRQFETRIFNLENMQAPKPEANLQKIKAEQSEEISRLIKDHETEKVVLKARIEDLIDVKNDAEMRLKLERNE